MANGAIVPSEATWSGTIHVEGVEASGTFEVFDSGGGWSFLFGKPLLCAFKAKHNYETDEVTIIDNKGSAILCNHPTNNEGPQTMNTIGHATLPTECSTEQVTSWTTTPPQTMGTLDTVDAKASLERTEIKNTESIFTRQTDLFAAPRVEYILQNVKIGTDLTAEEKDRVTKLITEYVDIFACSLGEVLPIPRAQVDLNIPEDVTFRTTVHQRPMNPPQRQFMHKWVD